MNAQEEKKRSYGEVEVKIEVIKKRKKVLTQAVIILQFRGGDSTWIQSLENTVVKYIKEKKRIKKGTYTATVNFVVEKENNINDVRLKLGTSAQKEIAVAIIQSIKAMNGWWNPNGGIKARAYYSTVITVPLAEEN